MRTHPRGCIRAMGWDIGISGMGWDIGMGWDARGIHQAGVRDLAQAEQGPGSSIPIPLQWEFCQMENCLNAKAEEDREGWGQMLCQLTLLCPGEEKQLSPCSELGGLAGAGQCCSASPASASAAPPSTLEPLRCERSSQLSVTSGVTDCQGMVCL